MLKFASPPLWRGRPACDRPRGSVLIFAIVLLSILAMLGTAFLLTVRQSSKASVNVLSNSEADNVAKSGLENAIRMLRSNVLRYSICTDTSVFEPTSPTFSVMPATDADVTNNTVPAISPLMQFRGFDKTNPRGILSLSDFAGDVWNYSGPHFTGEMLGGAHIPTGTQIAAAITGGPAPQFVTPASMFHIYVGTELVIDTAPNDETVVVTGVTDTSFQAIFTLSHTPGATGIQVGVLEFARRNVVTGSIGDFYQTTPSKNIRELGHLSATASRGEYYTWITDEDAKFYAVLQDWGVDNLNTDYPATPADICKNVLTNLNVFDPGDINVLGGLATTNVTNDTRFPAVRSNSELALMLPTTATAPGSTYELARNTLDTYVTPYKDTADFALPLSLKFCKDWSSAININTAPVEVIAAALSQIPSDNSTTPLTPAKVAALAKRIVAKRPFLCRMDFEDFLAAQIQGTAGVFGDPSDNSPGTSNPDTLPDDTDPRWGQDSTWWDDPANDPAPIVYYIYLALGRRCGPGNTTFPAGTPAPPATDPKYALWQAAQTPELNLSQYLEIPGVAATHPKLQGANTPAFQKLRFRWFFGTVAERDQAVAEGSLLTFKEFNNIINSVTTIYVNDDVQVKFPGDNIGTNATVVTLGPDGEMNTTPQGDDIYDNPAAPTKILTNPTGDGIAKTWVSLNRPSYYSYFMDPNLAEGIWTSIDDAILQYAKANPSGPPALYNATSVFDPAIASIPITTGTYSGMTIGDVIGKVSTITGAVYQMKVFYELPVQPGVPSTNWTDPSWKAPTILSVQHVTDLRLWRCQPRNSVYTDRRAGFYQMSFDDWTYTTPDTTFDYGSMQSSGDPEDTSGTYSTAHAPVLNSPITFNAPAVGGATGSGARGNGDVNWSPQFAFRSRFYGIYVLGRGLLQGAAAPRNLGERRLEAVYDALKDEVLWQRSQLSDKRSLGD